MGIDGQIVVKAGILYLSGFAGLWRSDGTPQGTTLVKGNPSVQVFWCGRPKPKACPGAFSADWITLAGGTLYFVGTNRKHGRELWRSDGTREGTKLVRDIRPGDVNSKPNNLTALGRTLLFTANARHQGRELWRAGPKPCKTAAGKCKKG